MTLFNFGSYLQYPLFDPEMPDTPLFNRRNILAKQFNVPSERMELYDGRIEVLDDQIVAKKILELFEFV